MTRRVQSLVCRNIGVFTPPHLSCGNVVTDHYAVCHRAGTNNTGPGIQCLAAGTSQLGHSSALAVQCQSRQSQTGGRGSSDLCLRPSSMRTVRESICVSLLCTDTTSRSQTKVSTGSGPTPISTTRAATDLQEAVWLLGKALDDAHDAVLAATDGQNWPQRHNYP